jgi:hypothetical protein
MSPVDAKTRQRPLSLVYGSLLTAVARVRLAVDDRRDRIRDLVEDVVLDFVEEDLRVAVGVVPVEVAGRDERDDFGAVRENGVGGTRDVVAFAAGLVGHAHDRAGAVRLFLPEVDLALRRLGARTHHVSGRDEGDVVAVLAADLDRFDGAGGDVRELPHDGVAGRRLRDLGRHQAGRCGGEHTIRTHDPVVRCHDFPIPACCKSG